MPVHQVATARGPVHVDEQPGAGPAIVMTHGFPDDARIYDRLLPELTGRHVVTFDFFGHGRSGRDADGWATPLAPGEREAELGAVIDALGLERVVLVGHDIGGPVTIRHALAHGERVAGLVLLNTFFGSAPALEFPEFIRLLADPHLAPLADGIIADQTVLGWMLLFTNARLNPGSPNADADGVGVRAILPQFFGGPEQPDAIAAIRAWTADLFRGVAEQDAQVAAGELRRLDDVPIVMAIGEDDPYLGPAVAEHLQTLLPHATRQTIAGAAHWPQWDQPAATAAAIAEVAR